MSQPENRIDAVAVDDLYAEAGQWHVNTGEETIHAKRLPGKWRSFKWWASSVWLVYFLGPYLRWDDRQAVLFDIPNRQFHIFGVTVLPQDFWMLALVLLFFAILLAVVTAVAGRVWCGFFCFQTVWTDLFTWLEEKLEGVPQQRRKLADQPWDAHKIRVKLTKHLLWMLIGLLTGVSFVAWFVDAYQLWANLASFNASFTAVFTILLFAAGTYALAGFLREQVCFWLCPYARIQGVMIDNATILPAYDFIRGEPRGRIKKGVPAAEQSSGDCVDCNQCVAVCPTGIDIRKGQQEGCITCALCIDACDTVMEKVGRPKGLIRYDSLDGLQGKPQVSLMRHPRVWVYSIILLASLSGIVYGLASLDATELKVIHDRQPLFVLQSDGSIQNKYTLKVLNKMSEDLLMAVSVDGPADLRLVGTDEGVLAKSGHVVALTVFVRIPRNRLQAESTPVTFEISGRDSKGVLVGSQRESVFIAPSR